MSKRLPDPSARIADMNKYAHGYMRHLFPYGQDGVCHTAFGDLTYTVEVDEKSELSLSMSLKISTGLHEEILGRTVLQERAKDSAAKLEYEISSGRITSKSAVPVKTTLDVLNRIDAVRVALLGCGCDIKKSYGEFLREREEERNPSLRLMKEAADKTMEQLYRKN